MRKKIQAGASWQASGARIIMASKVVTCKLQLDEEATRIAEAVAAMLEAQGQPSSIDGIVSNAVRLAYGQRITDLTNDARTTTAEDYVPRIRPRG